MSRKDINMNMDNYIKYLYKSVSDRFGVDVSGSQ